VTITRLANLEATFKLFIGNLPPDPSVELLQQMFAGRDAQEFIPIKNKPGMPNLKGSAFVKMGR
jgi:RNA recognition motif-containing protein